MKTKTPIKFMAHPVCTGLALVAARHVLDQPDLLRIFAKLLAPHGDFTLKRAGKESRLFLATTDGATLPNSRAWDIAHALSGDGHIEAIEPTFILPGIDPDPRHVFPSARSQARPASGGGDKLLECAQADSEWSARLINAEQAWALIPPRPEGLRFGEGIIVAHPDTGYTRHPEIFGPRLLTTMGHDFEDDKSDPLDPLQGQAPSHGTATASVIMSAVGAEAGSQRVTGIAPDASLVPLRISSSVVHWNFGNVCEAVIYAADQGHHVISMSLGGPYRSRALHEAIRYAIDRGVIVLAAAGNVWPFVVYPARFEEVIAVAAINCERAIWKNSATGDAVDLAAPGESVWRAYTEPGNLFNVGPSSGTSYAVAHVAGACALWLAFHGRDFLINRYGAANLSAVFTQVLVSNGVETPLGWDTQNCGAGILQADRLLSAPLPQVAPARGMLSARAGRPVAARSDFDDLAGYFPTSKPAVIRANLMKLFATDERGLNILLAEYGDELGFHLGTDPALRAAIASSTGKLSARAGSKTVSATTELKKVASRALKRRVR